MVVDVVEPDGLPPLVRGGADPDVHDDVEHRAAHALDVLRLARRHVGEVHPAQRPPAGDGEVGLRQTQRVAHGLAQLRGLEPLVEAAAAVREDLGLMHPGPFDGELPHAITSLFCCSWPMRSAGVLVGNVRGYGRGSAGEPGGQAARPLAALGREPAHDGTADGAQRAAQLRLPAPAGDAEHDPGVDRREARGQGDPAVLGDGDVAEVERGFLSPSSRTASFHVPAGTPGARSGTVRWARPSVGRRVVRSWCEEPPAPSAGLRTRVVGDVPVPSVVKRSSRSSEPPGTAGADALRGIRPASWRAGPHRG